MNSVWQIAPDCSLTLEDINSSVMSFIEKYEIAPDSISIHHSDLCTLSGMLYNDTHTILLEHSDNIKIRTYIGYIHLDLRYKTNEKLMANSDYGYIITYNKEMNKVDNILLGEES